MPTDYSKYLGIPYRARGRDFHHCDCWGLVRLFLKGEYGIELDNFTQYSVDNLEEVKRIAEEEKENWIKVEVPDVGDVVELKIMKRDWHVGIIPFHGYVLHICNNRFSQMDKITSPLICRNIKGYWRHRDLC